LKSPSLPTTIQQRPVCAYHIDFVGFVPFRNSAQWPILIQVNLNAYSIYFARYLVEVLRILLKAGMSNLFRPRCKFLKKHVEIYYTVKEPRYLKYQKWFLYHPYLNLE
jgi:hypothetical protein